MAWSVTSCSRIDIVPPRASEVGTLLQDDKVNANFFQSDTNVDARDASTNDHGLVLASIFGLARWEMKDAKAKQYWHQEVERPRVIEGVGQVNDDDGAEVLVVKDAETVAGFGHVVTTRGEE